MQILSRTAPFMGDDPQAEDFYDFETCYTRLHPDNGYLEVDVVAAMLKNHGNFAGMARDLGRSRNSIANHVERNDELRELRDDIRQSILDDIEHKGLSIALMGDTAHQRFFLQTLGKDRGYVTREERTGRDGEPIRTQSKIDVSKFDDDTLAALLEGKTD